MCHGLLMNKSPLTEVVYNFFAILPGCLHSFLINVNITVFFWHIPTANVIKIWFPLIKRSFWQSHHKIPWEGCQKPSFFKEFKVKAKKKKTVVWIFSDMTKEHIIWTYVAILYLNSQNIVTKWLNHMCRQICIFQYLKGVSRVVTKTWLS